MKEEEDESVLLQELSSDRLLNIKNLFSRWKDKKKILFDCYFCKLYIHRINYQNIRIFKKRENEKEVVIKLFC